VTQGTRVDVQGSYGEADDEKTELVSQKMLITRLTANAVTYGGYVNVSRQNIDFSSPQVLDIIINDLAARYAIQTESALAAELASTTTGRGRLRRQPDRRDGRNGGVDGRGECLRRDPRSGPRRDRGSAGPPRACSGRCSPRSTRRTPSRPASRRELRPGRDGLHLGRAGHHVGGPRRRDGFAFSTAAIEAFEQRVGTLQVTEPSVLGVQVAYAGYFTALTIEDDAIVPLTAT
jgi:hypothetical protein